jgi:predicted aldo/keto reductase-like oxidoreductase
MLYRRFGRTEIQMPVFSCGGMRYQHEWQDCPMEDVPPDNQANLEATVCRAVELGINHIETARGYGSSERQLGQVLPTLPRNEITVQTKIMPSADPAEFVSQFHESLERMRVDYVDLLGIHGINNHETLWWAIRPGGCLAAARKMVTQGKARHVGLSSHGPTEVILAAIEHQADGGFDYVNLHWFYIFQRHWPAIEAAAKADMGVFIISPTDKGGMLNKPSDKMIDLCRPMHPMVFNCLFCLSHPEVHSLSIGASQPGEFDLQLTTLDVLDRAEELLPPTRDRLEKTLIDTVGEELADPFAMDLPAWHCTPGDVNIPTILWLRNLALAYDMHEYGRMRYNLLGNGEHWFPGVTAAHLDDIDLSTVLAKSPLKDKIPDYLREAHELLFVAPKKRLSQS